VVPVLSICFLEITIHAPLINMTKSEITRKGTELGVNYSLTHSRYDPSPDGRI
jgi:7-cyano-7-deazaguanine synthase